MAEWMLEPEPRLAVRRTVALAILVVDDWDDRPIPGSQVRVNAVELDEPEPAAEAAPRPAKVARKKASARAGNVTATAADEDEQPAIAAVPQIPAMRPRLPLRPVHKPDGHIVFVNCTARLLDIRIDVPTYQPERLLVDRAKLDPRLPLMKLRMRPDRTHRFPPDATIVFGKADPGARIALVRDGAGEGFRLLSDVSDPMRIELHNPAGIDLEGRNLAIGGWKGDRWNGTPEILRIAGALADTPGTFEPASPLKETYRKAGTFLREAMVAFADEDGNYFLPLRNGAAGARDEEISAVLSVDGNEKRNMTVVLRNGRGNRLDLRTGQP